MKTVHPWSMVPVYLLGSRDGIGMNDKDSPIWGSDHFAVIADIKIKMSSNSKK
jgi:hypothetical protein